MNQIFKKKDYFFELRDNGKWILSTDDAKAGVKISTQKTSNKVDAVLGEGVIPHSLQSLFLTLHNSDYRAIYDKDMDTTKLLGKIGANTYWNYQKSKSMTFVSSRDFVLIHHIH